MDVPGINEMSAEGAITATIDAIQALADKVGIPRKITEASPKVKAEDVDFLAESAMADACTPGNPRTPTKEDIIAIYKSVM